MELVKSLNLPIWRYVDLQNRVKGNLLHLPRESLIYLNSKMTDRTAIKSEDTDWLSIQYVYYSEMDQILYARSLLNLYNVLDNLSPSVVFVPHRMDVRNSSSTLLIVYIYLFLTLISY